ncbi:MAG: efflux RND transporter periplasmic adaptor subunit [Bacteroidetes bacterium]|nr:efflux RND transporter periplasmic adaptor subunit [Bacteroidota bacterium]
MHKYIRALICLPFMVACGNHQTTKEVMDVTFEGDVIVINEHSPILRQIVVQKAHLQDFSAEFRTVGTIRPVMGKWVEITPPFAGRIVKTSVRLGQKINAGALLFELSSSEFYEAAKTYFSTQSENEVAQLNYNRQKELAANGVASQKELEQAQSQAKIAQQEYQQAKAALQVYHVDLATLQMGHPLRVVSPVAGEVIKCDITLGGYAKEEGGPLAVVADLSSVWVVALVKEKYFGAIKQGDRVEVYTDAHPNKIHWGNIYYIGEILDPETRSLEVIVACDNSDKELKIGMFCETHFLSAPTKAIMLPSTAILQEQENDYVWVELAKGRYVRRKVETESAIHNDEVHIISGISEGETVVTEGGFFLNL